MALDKKNITGWFITGIDTEVGKTLVATSLLYKLAQKGRKTLALKPVAAGSEWHSDNNLEGYFNEDALLLQKYANVELSYSQINPFCFRSAIAPHIAASQENIELTLDLLVKHWQNLPVTDNHTLIVEGAGGWLVPLNAKETLAQFAEHIQLPVIMVVSLRLGCLNHAQLTAQAIQHSGLKLAAWVANTVDPGVPYQKENLHHLKAVLPGKFLGWIPYMDNATAEKSVEYIQLPDH